MDEKALRRALELGYLTADDVLWKTIAAKFDKMVGLLKTCRPSEEVCNALIERIGEAPLNDLDRLKVVFFKHYPN